MKTNTCQSTICHNHSGADWKLTDKLKMFNFGTYWGIVISAVLVVHHLYNRIK